MNNRSQNILTPTIESWLPSCPLNHWKQSDQFIYGCYLTIFLINVIGLKYPLQQQAHSSGPLGVLVHEVNHDGRVLKILLCTTF